MLLLKVLRILFTISTKLNGKSRKPEIYGDNSTLSAENYVWVWDSGEAHFKIRNLFVLLLETRENLELNSVSVYLT